MPAITVDTAVAVQLATRNGQLHQLRVHVPALLAGSAMEDASSPIAAQRVSTHAAPLLGLQGLSISMSSSGTRCCPVTASRLMRSSSSTSPLAICPRAQPQQRFPVR